MAKIVQVHGDNRSNSDAYTGAIREITMDTDGMELRLHDGLTPGGKRVLNLDANNLLYQAKDSSNLTPISMLASSAQGMLTRRSSGNWTTRTLVGTAGQITVVNGSGYAGNPTISLPNEVTKAITFSAGITADVTGNVTGNVTGDLTGDSTGTHTGAVVGDVTGNLTGNANGDHIGTFTGDVDVSSGTLTLADSQIPLAKVNGAQAAIESGTIVMWYGDINSIPAGWYLCDGANSTPDLRGKFIVGAGNTGSAYHMSDTGGSSNHNHGGATTSAAGGAHTPTGTVGSHTLTTDEIPAHAHLDGVPIENGVAATYDTVPNSDDWMVDTNTGGAQVQCYTSTVGGGNPHNHTLTMDAVSNHTHNVTITSDSNLPPYYALAFIMKA